MAKVASSIQIQQLSRFFDHLVELIPARFYNTNEDDQPDLRYMKKDARMAEKKARKIKAKAAKRAKLDPDKSQTALDLQKQGTQDDISDSESSEEDEEDDTEPDLQNRDGGAHSPGDAEKDILSQPANTGKSIQLNDKGHGPSMEDLKARLAKRLEVFRTERKAEAKKEQVQKAKQWRESALRQNKSKGSAKRKASAAVEEPQKDQVSVPEPQPVAKASEPEVQLTFGQLVFNDGQDDRKPKRQKKMSKAQLLEEVEKKAADKEKLAASGTGKEELQKQAWSSALSRARGEKILDDPKLLRKSLKKDEKLKKKKGAAWKEREQLQKKDTHDRQKRRRDNLNKRVQDKQKKKIEKREKKLTNGSGKQTMRPGFEGRRSTTIN